MYNYWPGEGPGECTIVLDEVGDVGEMVRGTFEGSLVNAVEDSGFGTTHDLSNGSFEFKVVGIVDGQPVNAAPEITTQNYDGFGNSLRLALSVGELRLGWDTTVEGPVDVTGHLEVAGVEGRICAGSGSFLNLDPMESLPWSSAA